MAQWQMAFSCKVAADASNALQERVKNDGTIGGHKLQARFLGSACCEASIFLDTISMAALF
jgi:hypothetical protein